MAVARTRRSWKFLISNSRNVFLQRYRPFDFLKNRRDATIIKPHR